MIQVRFNETILPAYVSEVIQTPLGRWILSIKREDDSRQLEIVSEDINNFPIPLPPLSVQREIVNSVEAARAAIASERERASQIAREAEAEIEAMILGTRRMGASGTN